MVRGAIAFIDKRQIPTTNVVGGKFHNRLLIELEESWLLSMGEAVGFDLLRFFQDYHGVFSFERRGAEVYAEKHFCSGEFRGKKKGSSVKPRPKLR